MANAVPRSTASRPTFARVSSSVRSCLVPRSLKSSKMEGRRITLGASRWNVKYWHTPLLWSFALHNRLLRRQHCSSLCEQSEGYEHVANMTSALAHDFVEFLAGFGRHNIRPPHFASKVSYSASPQTSAKCPRSAPCSDATFAMLFASKPRKDFSKF